MTTKAGTAQILVVLSTSVFVVHVCLVVFMAEDTLKCRVVTRIDMALGAVIPLLPVGPGIDGKKLSIVIPVR